MKRFLFALIVILLVIISYCIITAGSFLKTINNFSLLSSSNNAIPIRLYERSNSEIVLIFDEKLNMGIYQVLIISPNHKIIGIPEGGKRSYVNLFPNVLFQKKEAVQYTIIGTVFFENNQIFDVEFVNNNEVKFKSLLKDLKAYGDVFVLKWEK